LVAGASTLTHRLERPPEARLCRQAEEEARRLEMAGDLNGAFAVLDGLPGPLRERPDIGQRRRRIAGLLHMQAVREVRHRRASGDLLGALAICDGLPDGLRDHPDIGHERGRVCKLLCRQSIKQAGELRREGNLLGALAVLDALPRDLREDADTLQQRGDLLERLGKLAQKQASRLRAEGDLSGALAVYDDLPPELRERVGLVQERAHLLHILGRLPAAEEMLRKALATDPGHRRSWQSLVSILRDLDRIDELRTAIAGMVSALPPDFDTLVEAARMARKGKLFDLADEMIDRALAARVTASADAIVKAAQDLLSWGEQGRVVKLLDCEPVHADASVREIARALSAGALAQLRLAGRSGTAGPVRETERADVTAARAILEHQGPLVAPDEVERRGIVVVTSSLGTGGSQKQAVELVRQLCNSSSGPVRLFALARSGQENEFFQGGLAGLDLTVEFLSDFELAPQAPLPADLAGKLSVLPPKIRTQTVCLIHRLRLNRPQSILAMSDIHGVSVMLAASVVGVPRIVVSARTLPPPACRRPDHFFKPVYQVALARNIISLVTNAEAAARAFADWLEVPRDRIGTVYNGIDVDGLVSQRDPAAGAAYRRELGIPAGARIVGSVFQARTQKRPRLWIEAAAVIAKRAPDVAFVVVGDKHLFDDVSATLARYGLEGRFHRPGVRSDVATWLGLMDVFLLTSETEGTPNAMLEAQALGRPVIATDVGGNAETFVPEMTGLLVPAHPTPEQIADAVLRVLDDPAFAARARALGPRFIRQRFDLKRMASAYVDLLLDGAATHAATAILGERERIL
jgi:glycosyltransferase involved in cell wall biosynthesis/tetratricopeptide (TPR) repeat protein